MPRAPSWTDEQLTAAVAESGTYFEVCRRLDLRPGRGTYDSLTRHMERLELDFSHLARRRRQQGRLRRSWTDDDLANVVADCATVSDVLRQLGYTPSGGMHRFIKAHIARLDLDTSHFVGQRWAAGLIRSGTRLRPLTEILVENSPYTSAALRRRLIREGLKDARCERCGLTEWQDEPLPLMLDHINGNHVDNRLENLRILCPNCHALTPTWCARNRKPA